MAAIQLESLPEELIAHIATHLDAPSVLTFSRISKKLRRASYDGVVFKAIISNAQRDRWERQCLDFEAISQRAGNDTNIWARYAVADDKAWILCSSNDRLEFMRTFINFLPELLVVKHPFVYDERWARIESHPAHKKPSQLFCLTLCLIACGKPIVSTFSTLQVPETSFQRPADDIGGYLCAAGRVAHVVNLAMDVRTMPPGCKHFRHPSLSQIPLRPRNDAYSLPKPFSRRAMELFGRSTSGLCDWDSWFHLHNLESFRDEACLTDGTWCGYYTYRRVGVSAAEILDEPMSDIRFQITTRQREEMTGNVHAVQLHAADANDGVGKFDLEGTMSYKDRVVELRGRKRYTSVATAWDWDCRLTPFGIAGFWGIVNGATGRLDRAGCVWLWKKEWTETS